MTEFSMRLILDAVGSDLVPISFVICSLNMLVQILFSVCFGSKAMPKIRGYRGE